MTDNDIIKALELCKTKSVADCKECSFHIDEIEINANCIKELCENALDLINRQKAEIERLQTEVAREIFAEIEKFIQNYCNDDNYTIGDMLFEVAELKNKYTKEGVGE